MFPRHGVYLSLVLLVLLFGLVACNDDTNQPPEATQLPAATPDPLQASPQPVLAELPLLGEIPEIPNVFIVPSSQSKLALAAFLKTTPEQLNWVNPGLPDSIAPGTLVVIPPIYRTAGETLAEVAQKTGLAEDVLRTANPRLADDESLAAGMLLAMPALYIVATDLPLSSAAATLDTSNEALLAANPALATHETVLAGTVLVVPPEK